MKKKILVVENDQDIREILTVILTEEGYEIITFKSTEIISEHIIAYKPDAILLDIIRPTDEGTELCRQIKAAETTKHIPVIVMSTYTKTEVLEEICADKVIAKPFDIDVLVNVIQNKLKAAIIPKARA
ncbi:response regulator receiver protein [Arcticibacter svalbardensis MN12-7]|uniref:Response regulator receiver protein n=1 Tax=Arcticibacter svalbardensis MN12-7 TaxID=1150600 RepID=R9GYJ7_9SPHI|nr:response regulator [Arcticibacter svalbardensis]EOR96565.1 response regulator receiver protein [Arcticibacter svalbardensis MN12-7]